MIEEMTLRISIIMPTDVLGDKSNLYKAVTQRLFSMNASLHDVWNRILQMPSGTTRHLETGGWTIQAIHGERERRNQTVSNGYYMALMSLLMIQHLEDTL